MKPDTRELELAAIHEAAHAVLAKESHANVTCVVVKRNGKGKTSHNWKDMTLPWAPEDTSREGNRAKGKMWIAGLLAESRANGESLESFLEQVPALRDGFSGEDAQGLEDCAEASLIPWRNLVCECAEVLDARWSQVEALAGAMLAKWIPGEAEVHLGADEILAALKEGTK